MLLCFVIPEIVSKVSKRKTPVTRPAIFPENQGVPLAVVKLMQTCWHDKDTERPTFSVIRAFIKKSIQHGRYVFDLKFIYNNGGVLGYLYSIYVAYLCLNEGWFSSWSAY